MSGKCGPTLVAVADAAPDNWTFLERLRPDEQAVDFFHACEHPGEVANHAVATDWYDKYRAARRCRRRRQGYSGTTSATRRRRKRRPRFLSASSGSSAGTDAACATRASRSEVTRSGVVREQGAGQPAHETGRHALERRRRPERPHLQGVVGPLRRCVAGDTGRRERQSGAERRLTAESYKQNRDVKRETGFLQK